MQCRHFTIRLSPQHLVEDEERLNMFLSQVEVHMVKTSLVAPKGERWSVLVFFEQRTSTAEEPPQRRRTAPVAAPTLLAPALSAEEQRIYDLLREWRGERAKAEDVPPYVIAHNAVLLQIARHHMSLSAAEDLAPIKHFGAQKAARYGADILQLLQLRPASEEPLFDDDYAR